MPERKPQKNTLNNHIKQSPKTMKKTTIKRKRLTPQYGEKYLFFCFRNIDFHIKYQRNRDRVPITILGQILEYQVGYLYFWSGSRISGTFFRFWVRF